MPRVNPNKIKADWTQYERRPTWSIVSSRELSGVLGVSLNCVCNWRLRGILPNREESNDVPSGNRNWYRISKVRAWLENRDENEIHWEWADKFFPELAADFRNLTEVEYLVKNIPDHFDVERSLVPANFYWLGAIREPLRSI